MLMQNDKRLKHGINRQNCNAGGAGNILFRLTAEVFCVILLVISLNIMLEIHMKKQRNSKQRQMILNSVTARCDHPTADQIYLDIRAKDNKISRGTVYRNLAILAENNDIMNVKVPAADRYDLRTDRHYHIYCVECGKVFDAPLNYHTEYDEQIEKESGFQINRHRLIFEGVCPECIEKRQK